MNEHVRTRACRYVWVTYFKKKKTSAADVAAAAAAAAAAATAAVGHTKPGSESLYARVVGLTLEPFVHVEGKLR